MAEIEIGIFDDDDSKIKKFAFIVDGTVVDVVICDYSDRHFIIITQFQKLGSLISVTKGSARNLSELSNIYDIKTICGFDSQDYHLASRYLAEQLNIVKPALFSICLKNVTVETLRVIAKALKAHWDF